MLPDRLGITLTEHRKIVDNARAEGVPKRQAREELAKMYRDALSSVPQ